MDRNRLKKFNQEASKRIKYEEMERADKQKQTIFDDVPGAKEFIDANNLENVAAVFSYEGINIFLNLFEQSIDTAIKKTMAKEVEPIIEKILERKLQEIMKGANIGLQKFISDMSNTISPENKRKIETPSKDIIRNKNVVLTNSKLEIQKYIPQLMEIIREQSNPFMMGKVMQEMIEKHGVGWTHGSVVVKCLVAKGYDIKRIKFGQYVYTPQEGEEIEVSN